MFHFSKPGIESFFRTLNITDFDISPNEEEVVYSTNLNGYYNLWALNMGKRYPYQLTTSNQVISFVKYDPKNRYVLTGYDHDGDEDYHIYAIPPAGGETTPILQKKGEKYYYGDLSKDGKTLYYITSVNNPNFLNICRLNLETNEDQILIQGEEGPSYIYSVSPDESSFSYCKQIGNSSTFGYILKNGESILLTPSKDEAHRVNQVEYMDSDSVIMLTNYQSEFSYLASFSISTGVFERVVGIEGFELTKLTFERDSGKVYYVAQRGVEDLLYQYDFKNKQLTLIEKPVDIVDKLVIGSKGTIFVLGRSATKPGNLYRTSDLKSWEQLTYHQIIGVSQEHLTVPEVITYESFDGMKMEALFYPANPEKQNGHTVLWPHGGPQHAVRKNFTPLFQCLCSQGYQVFAPNFRGSTGYGESFVKLVNKDWGGGPRLDIIAGMEWLDKQGKSNPDKWFCIGGSYGGYMTLLLHGRHADKFKAFVDIFGPSNLFTTIETAPEHWKAADRELIGDPAVDREKLIEDSPMTYIDHMTKPMLVIQGENDPRVVKIESDVIVEALQKRDQDVEYLILPDEGHGFSKTENAIMVYTRMIEFLGRYI